MLEPLFITHVFGVRHFGAVSGSLAMVSFVGQLAGSIGGAFLFDLTGSYSIPYWLYTLGFGLSALLFSVLAERRPPHIAQAKAMGRIDDRAGRCLWVEGSPRGYCRAVHTRRPSPCCWRDRRGILTPGACTKPVSRAAATRGERPTAETRWAVQARDRRT
jgi:hypothetical protein